MSTRVTGFGGLFFKTLQPTTIRDWYDQHLGLPSPHGMAILDWTDPGETKGSYTLWSVLSQDTTYFEPGKKDMMLNFRVNDLDAVIAELAAEEVAMAGEPQTHEYGRFGWIMDPGGYKIELWQANDKDEPVKSSLRDDGVTGIAELRVFVSDPERWLSWYNEHLGIPREGDALVFSMKRNGKNIQTRILGLPVPPSKAGLKQEWLAGYSVNDLAATVSALKAAGVEVPVVTSDNALLCDPDGRYLQLLQV